MKKNRSSHPRYSFPHRFSPGRLAWFLVFAFAPLIFSVAARAQDNDSLRVKIECEEPSGIFLERETLAVRRAILFSVHAFNETSETRNVTLTWRIRDAGGKVVQSGNQKYPIPAGGHITRRELFNTPKLGAFTLQADAFSRRDGPDLKADSEFPFAVVAAPASGETRPFLLLDTPLELSEKQLEALSRLGARALRTEISPSSGQQNGDGFWSTLQSSLETRSARGLATVGVLRAPMGEGPRNARDDEEWLQWALRVILQTPSVRTWEITGQPSPATVSELARAARNMNPSRSVFATARGTDGDWKRLQPAAGLLYLLSPRTANVHSSALRRAMLGVQTRSRENGLPTFHVRNVGALNTSNKASALESAQLMSTQTVAALAAGAQGASTLLFANDQIGHESLARGAAFAALNAQLGEAEFHSDVFPTSPVIMGAIFSRENGGSVAVLWTAPGMDGKESKGKLDAWLPDAELFDVFGNLTASAERKSVAIPLSAQPVFLTSNANAEEVARRFREGFVSGIAPVAAQVLPLNQPVEYLGEMKPHDNKFLPSNRMAIRVRLHNIGVGNLSGTLKLNPPPSWKFDVDNQQFSLSAGESRVYEFGVASVKPNDKYPVKVMVSAVQNNGGKTVRGSWDWTQNAMIATATNITPEETVTVDGVLGDWSDAQWMEQKSRRVNARLALKWDAMRLYVAARVKEAKLQPRNPDGEYAFWRGDAVQIGFGLRDATWMQPGSTPFRDTDFGFLLSPFHTRADGTIEARVLRLWSTQVPFGALSDRTRWGGAVNGARVEIRRDERSGETIYEAAIPLSEIPDLNPSARAATVQQFDSPVRFGWILHNDEGEKLQWARENNVFEWWNATGSFLPTSEFSLAAQTLLGFAQKGEVAAGAWSTPAPAAPPASVIAPEPVIPPPPMEAPVLPPDPVENYLPPYLPNIDTTPVTPAGPNVPPAPAPIPTGPIPDDLLPPAPPPNN